MVKKVLIEVIGWGFLLWLLGYALGIMLFTLVPISLIGWIILPIGTLGTIYILWKKIKSNSFLYYLWISISWTFIAIVCDYFFLVKAFNPPDGYYKLDIYLYYGLSFFLPIIVGRLKTNQSPDRMVGACKV